MESSVLETGPLFTSGIKRYVKDRRISKTAKLNVSLASKIKTKIINNSSILKISLKHNNRALAQALSREKANSRSLTTEKMLLQKEVEKLNFENTFLRLKLNNLNKKLIEIEALMNNNLITAIEMSSLSEFHQSPFVRPSSPKTPVSKQCTLTRLPFARVPLTSNDDDGDDDDKENMQKDSNFMSKSTPDPYSLVSTKQPLPAQYPLELTLLKEKNQNVHDLEDADILSKESHPHSEQSSKSSLVSERHRVQCVSHRKDQRSSSKVTERKRHVPSRVSDEPTADTPFVTELGQPLTPSPGVHWSEEIPDQTQEANMKIQGEVQCLPGSSSKSVDEPATEGVHKVQGNDDLQLQKTVYYDADMDLTAGEVSKIITVSTRIQTRSNKDTNGSEVKTFRRVKDSSSKKKKERLKRQVKSSVDVASEEKNENRQESSVVANGIGASEDPDFICGSEQLTQVNLLQKGTLRKDLDEDDRQRIQCNKKKGTHLMNEQEETCAPPHSSDKSQQETNRDTGQLSFTCPKSRASRQTFVINKFEKGNLLLSQTDKETICEKLEVTNECPAADLSTKDHGNLHAPETQNMWGLKEPVADVQPAQQNESKANKKLRQKTNRKTEIISQTKQRSENYDNNAPELEIEDIFFQTQQTKETVPGNVGVSSEFRAPVRSIRGDRNLCNWEVQNGDLDDYGTQGMLGLKRRVTNMQPAQHNEVKVDKKVRQKTNRRTEIISKISQMHENNVNGTHDPETEDFFFQAPENKETISGNADVSSEFQTLPLSTRDNRNLYNWEIPHVLGVQKQILDRYPVEKNESKVNKKLRQKVSRKTEIISETNHRDPDKGGLCAENDSFVFQKEDSSGFPTPALYTKDSGSLCHTGTPTRRGAKKPAPDVQTAGQKESEMPKKLGKKVGRKTEVISEMNQINENNLERGNLLSVTQKENKTIPEKPEDAHEFQLADSATGGQRTVCDDDTQSMLGLKKRVAAQQHEQKVSKKPRQKANRKTEIISEVNQINDYNSRYACDPVKGNSFSLTPKDKEDFLEDLEIINEFQTTHLATKENRNVYDYGTQNMWGLKKRVPDKQPAQQHESKVNKKCRQNRKTEIISEINQIYEDNDKARHSPDSHTNHLDFKISKSKRRRESQDINNRHCMEINSNEKENWDHISNPYKLVQKHRKESSGRAKTIVANCKHNPVLPITGSPQNSISLELGLKQTSSELDSNSRNELELHKNQRQSTSTVNKKRKCPFVEVMEGGCQDQKANKMTSQSKKRKTVPGPCPGSLEVTELTSSTLQGESVQLGQVDKDKNLDIENIVNTKLDFHRKKSKPSSQIRLPQVQDSSCKAVLADSVQLSFSPRRCSINGSFDLADTPVLQVCDDVPEKKGEVKGTVNRRTHQSAAGYRMLQDLTNTSFVSNNTPKSERIAEDLSSELPGRRRRCVPLSLKEPSLKGKMRR
ncbi:shugoshin 2 [Echinops telfairi]|uniref:Shugoshin 2 n=1 Tax=Echinops telfairi TaxID=9371 RepID=A0AC55DIP8_ECHTE|nr:shugoshin 2 [Echinops telfairi]